MEKPFLTFVLPAHCVRLETFKKKYGDMYTYRERTFNGVPVVDAIPNQPEPEN